MSKSQKRQNPKHHEGSPKYLHKTKAPSFEQIARQKVRKVCQDYVTRDLEKLEIDYFGFYGIGFKTYYGLFGFNYEKKSFDQDLARFCAQLIPKTKALKIMLGE